MGDVLAVVAAAEERREARAREELQHGAARADHQGGGLDLDLVLELLVAVALLEPRLALHELVLFLLQLLHRRLAAAD